MTAASKTWRLVVLACIALATATLLVWPEPAAPRRVTWEQLLFPLVPGALVTRGYTLSSPRRGEEQDVVFTARRDDPRLGPQARIEVHIVKKGQWPGIRETKSFGVAYEMPRSTAAVEDLEAVTENIANHLRTNDLGHEDLASIPLADEPSPPWMTRVLDRMRGARGAFVLGLLCLALGFVASLPHYGDALAAGLLFLLGLGLRLPHLDIPFTHDQDVQRLFTGQYPLLEILTGKGLEDRHPPLWFVVLHAVGSFGQTETWMRLPAVLSGALIGPALVWAAHLVRGRGDVSGALCGLVVTVSPELVLRSREVSEIPFFSVLVIVATALATRLSSANSTVTQRRALAVVTALLAWTYYLAPLVLLGIVLSLALTRRLKKDVLVALGWGVLGGAPALLLGAWTIVRDHGARSVAAQFPTLAWGERSSLQTLDEMAKTTLAAVGLPIVVLSVISAFWAWRWRRDGAPLVALGVVAVTTAGIAVAARFARVQPYYIVAIVPVLPLAVALGPSVRSHLQAVGSLFCAASLLGFGLSETRLVYMPDVDAFMPKFASFAFQRSEQRIIVVAHYDATLLAYYLERAAGGAAAWPSSEQDGEFVLTTSGRHVLPLAGAHALDAQSEERARSKLNAALEKSPALVIERDGFVLDQVHAELARCDTLLTASTARLLFCKARSMP